LSSTSSNLTLSLPDEPEALYCGVTLTTWLKTLIIAALFVATFRFDLRRLWDKTNPIYGDANWAHAIFIPIIGLYYLYLNREELQRAPVEPLLAGKFSRARGIGAAACLAVGVFLYLVGPRLVPQVMLQAPIKIAGIELMILGGLVALLDWGIGLFLFGLLIFQYGIWPGRNDWTSDAGVVVTLFGLVLLLCGWKVMRIAWFPIVFLMCAVPWPPLIYSKVAMPLQMLAARVAVWVLNLTGVDAAQGGTKIFMPRPNMPDRALNVAEACAGMRSLMTFISVAAAVAFLSVRPLWQRIILTLSAIPIAIFCNVMRVSGQGLLDHYFTEKMSEGFAHAFVGLIMLMPAFFLILLVAWILDQLFIEEDDSSGPRKPQPGIITRQRASSGEGA
jgi:exosortase